MPSHQHNLLTDRCHPTIASAALLGAMALMQGGAVLTLKQPTIDPSTATDLLQAKANHRRLLTQPGYACIPWWGWMGLLIWTSLLFGVSLVSSRALTMHEAVLPQSAREMWHAEEWIVPTSGARPWLERPPLPQWLAMGLIGLTGAGDQIWPYRLVSLLAATTVVLLSTWQASTWFGRDVGLLTGFFLASMYEFVNYAWLAEQDIVLCLVVTATIVTYLRLEKRWQLSAQSAHDATTRPTLESHAPLTLVAVPPHTVSVRRHWWWELWSNRGCGLWLFFLLLGATNLVKGLLFGSAMALLPILAFWLWQRDRSGFKRFSWIWGGLLALAVALAWPVAVWWRYPDVLALWHYDLVGRLDGSYRAITQPIWYYPLTLLWVLLPWTPLVGFGLLSSWRRAWRDTFTPERFLWCWALAPVLVFSLASGKHHHYLLHCLPAWAMLAALAAPRLLQSLFALPAVCRHWLTHLSLAGLVTAGLLGILATGWLKIPALATTELRWLSLAVVPVSLGIGWGLQRRQWSILLATCLLAVLAGYSYLHERVLAVTDQTWPDTRFLLTIKTQLQSGDYLLSENGAERTLANAALQLDTAETQAAPVPLYVNAAIDSMDLFRILFYLSQPQLEAKVHASGNRIGPHPVQVLHTLEYLWTPERRTARCLVLTRAKDEAGLQIFGRVRRLAQSERSRRETSPADRLTLFEIQFTPDLETLQLPEYISPMKAMYRE